MQYAEGEKKLQIGNGTGIDSIASCYSLIQVYIGLLYWSDLAICVSISLVYTVLRHILMPATCLCVLTV
jgi:hypothetical protein